MNSLSIENFKIDKTGWKKVKFGDVVYEPKETVKDPVAEGIEHVVGLEHIDSEDIHLRRSANIEESTTFTKKFSKGDVLFGRRRAYLKKAAVADFQGICSGDITVMRAKSNLSPALLPYIVNNDAFFDFAVEHSAGGLSPRVKFNDLKKYDFSLPPKGSENVITKLLSNCDLLIESKIKTLNRAVTFKKSALKEFFKKDKCEKWRVSEISTSLDNLRIPIKKSERKKGTYPYYGASGIVDHVEGYIFDEPILLISEDGENLSSRKLPIAYEVDEKCWVNNHAHVLRIQSGFRYFVAEYFNSHDMSGFITEGTRPKITKGMLEDIPIYIPPSNKRENIERQLRQADQAILQIEEEINALRVFKKNLIREVFG